MQEMEQAVLSGTDRRQVEAVVETLANLGGKGESVAELMHDARNMVTALGLYCDLLEEPGVLTTPFQHYGSELKLVAAASRRLVERLGAIESGEESGSASADDNAFEQTGLSWTKAAPQHPHPITQWELTPATPIDDLAQELHSDGNLLSALSGPAIRLTVDTVGADMPVRMSGEDLTRILVNLVKNSVEAMPAGGKIHLSLRQSPHGARRGSVGDVEHRRQRPRDCGRCAGKHLRARLHDADKGGRSQIEECVDGRTPRPGPLHHAVHRGSCGRTDSSSQPRPFGSLLPD